MNFIEKSLEIRNHLKRLFLGWICPSILDTEKSREELNALLNKHWGNNPVDVYELIYENWEELPKNPQSPTQPKTQNFIVFIDQDLDVDWITEKELTKENAECVSIAQSISARRCKHLLHEQRFEFKRLIGQAIVSGIQGNLAQSKKLASEASQFLKDRTVERSRDYTLSSANLSMVLILLLAQLIFVWSSENPKIPEGLLFSSFGGIIGVYLSVIQKAGIGNWDAASGWWIHWLEVITKLFAGVLFGAIAFALSQSVLAPPLFKSIAGDNYALFIVGVGVGLFERTIPKMISKYLETSQTEK